MPIMRSRMLAYPPSQLLFALVTQREEGEHVAWRDQTFEGDNSECSADSVYFCLQLFRQHTMGKKSSPSTFLNFFTFDLQITWNLTPPFSPLFKPKLIKDMKNNTTNDMPRETRDILSCECFFSTLYVDCVNHYVIMKTEIRAARALAWRLLGLVT